MLSTSTVLLPLALLASTVSAQLSGLRGTIPGSLHQCEQTNLFFFDSNNDRPLSVLFLPSSEIPDSIRSGTITVDQAQQYSPLLALSDITTPDAQQYNFELQIAEGTEFEVFAFLPNGEGKALSLTRTVTTPLPGASSCLTNIPTQLAGAGATTSAPESQATSTSTSSSSMSMITSSRSSGSSSASSSRSTSASQSGSGTLTAASGASPTSAASRQTSFDFAGVAAWTVALGGAAIAASGLFM
ncbi:uncharacterized protein JCM6883_000497 [Sporobolomyces salmoneus]|uniref:uncharacterized protein n=1 Tax=Sporobolomyces salmoneus TaxID=183962 RepID=UPI0031712402